jgi:hypothetical protein
MDTTDPEDISTTEGIVNVIREAVASEDVGQLELGVLMAATFCFKQPSPQPEAFPELLFDLIIRLMTEQHFLKMDASHKLLMLFEYDWGRLSEDQRARLLDSIKESYDKFEDWMSCFVISELLGQHYCNEAAFEVLRELQKTSNETARSLVPHGFEHIVKEAENFALRKRAMSSLLSMQHDKSSQVTKEVAVAIGNLSGRRPDEGQKK